ncbi:MAG: PilN domain-containing protein [Dethiobacter sp.]|nr:PilN domain-containing protein [Dethiobacter sp.]MCL4464046.1 PilN domain-containing protein [Bacillota bacterium]MCL5993060.1 PilN domain-containing protein [Bacillota bacterium]
MIRINLLPAEMLAEMRINERKSKAIKAVGAAALFLLAAYSLFFVLALQVRGQIFATAQERVAVEMEAATYEPYQQLKNRIERQSGLLKKAMGSPLAWRDLLAALGTQIPRNVWLTNLSLSQSGELVLQGLTFDHPAVANWLAKLAEIPEVTSLHLEFSAEESLDAATQVRFEIRTTLAPGLEYAPPQEGDE